MDLPACSPPVTMVNCWRDSNMGRWASVGANLTASNRASWTSWVAVVSYLFLAFPPLDLPALERLIATACFVGRPSRFSFLTFFPIAFRDEPRLRGIRTLLSPPPGVSVAHTAADRLIRLLAPSPMVHDIRLQPNHPQPFPPTPAPGPIRVWVRPEKATFASASLLPWIFGLMKTNLNHSTHQSVVPLLHTLNPVVAQPQHPRPFPSHLGGHPP